MNIIEDALLIWQAGCWAFFFFILCINGGKFLLYEPWVAMRIAELCITVAITCFGVLMFVRHIKDARRNKK